MQAINWDFIEEPTASERFELPAADGFVIRITDVTDDEEKQKLTITYDIAEGEHAGLFASSEFAKRNDWLHQFEVSYGVEYNSWRNEQVDNKPWFKKFFRCIEDSNPGYRFDGAHPQTFIGKIVGVVFKDYFKTNERGYDDHRWYFYRAYRADEIRNGAYQVPDPVDKRVAGVSAPAATADGYEDIPFM